MISGRGAETSIGKLPAKVYNYINRKFDGVFSDYAEAAENGDVPEELDVSDGYGEFGGEGDLHQSYGPIVECSYLTVIDVDSDKTLISDAKVEDFTDEPEDVERLDVEDGKHVWVYQSEEKGDWSDNEIEIEGKFDKKKLKIAYCVLPPIACSYSIVSGIVYDGAEYDLDMEYIFTDGKSVDLRIV